MQTRGGLSRRGRGEGLWVKVQKQGRCFAGNKTQKQGRCFVASKTQKRGRVLSL